MQNAYKSCIKCGNGIRPDGTEFQLPGGSRQTCEEDALQQEKEREEADRQARLRDRADYFARQ